MAARKAYAVTGAAVVLKTKSGSERYLYHGARVVTEEFDAASLRNAVSNKLIGEVTVSDETDPTTDAAAKAKADADVKAKAEADAKAKTDAANAAK